MLSTVRLYLAAAAATSPAGRGGAHLSDWLRLQTPRCHSTPAFTLLTNTLPLHLPPPHQHPPAHHFFRSIDWKCAGVAQIVLDVRVCFFSPFAWKRMRVTKVKMKKLFFPIIASHASTHTTSTPAVVKMRPLWLPCASWGTVFSQPL